MATHAEASTSQPRIKHLVLDAGPLLSLAPLRGVAEHYYTTPQIIAELKDPRARTHFENLGITAGVQVQVRQPDLLSVAQVTATAKKTGDYSVLSPADLGVIALTHALATDEAANEPQETLNTEREGAEEVVAEDNGAGVEEEEAGEGEDEESSEEEADTSTLQEDLDHLDLNGHPGTLDDSTAIEPSEADAATDSSPSSDGEGEWITPANVSVHKSRARELVPSTASGSREEDQQRMGVACMTADYAVQNVLLHMGLNLVSVDGKRITKVKSWVLRCHACFKICKDPSKKFCPSCGNATLLRTSVSTVAATSSTELPTFQVHLKPNFQYRTRGTIYPIPLPKPGQAKGGNAAGSGLVLREDQPEFQRALLREKGRQAKEERVMARAVEAVARGERPRGEGSWEDPDWVPGMLLGEGGRKRGGGLPRVGHGRKNPNEARRRKK
ncbi:hypothetical protein CALCODRAFT_513732 [Calocera cornea HHB12733]|uniref:20S-pre-rRNA D-site endonuclease NOB1 n=1 Tax=Calocera cornea HHB12733 TaxID=1353952 RepID=A0A165K8K5_9BASI|nr:hypothetical protein CALCODRAFT_513732 [Calocera cornea HHB12733]